MCRDTHQSKRRTYPPGTQQADQDPDIETIHGEDAHEERTCASIKRDATEVQGSLTLNEHLLENEQNFPAHLQLDAASNARTVSGATSGTGDRPLRNTPVNIN